MSAPLEAFNKERGEAFDYHAVATSYGEARAQEMTFQILAMRPDERVQYVGLILSRAYIEGTIAALDRFQRGLKAAHEALGE